MNNVIFYLSTCDTCRRIIKLINDLDQFQLVDIKKHHIKKEELRELKSISQLSYEELFNKRARKFKEIKGSHDIITEEMYMDLITGEYTFLKRPIVVYNNQVFVGNSKNVIESMVMTVNA